MRAKLNSQKVLLFEVRRKDMKRLEDSSAK
jgi:hypothetical protein